MASLKKRGNSFQIQYYVGKKQRRIGLGQVPLQIAKEKLRQFESARMRGDDIPLPTRTPIADVVTAYVEHIRAVKTPKSAQTDIYYLREVFGPICPALEITSRIVTDACKKRPRPKTQRRQRVATVEASHFENITTADLATFISTHTRTRGLAPKTANRYREVIVRLFNWATHQRGVTHARRQEPRRSRRTLQGAGAPDSLSHVSSDRRADRGPPGAPAAPGHGGHADLHWPTPGRNCSGSRARTSDSPPASRGLIHVRAKTANGQSWQPKTRNNRAVPVSTDLRAYLDAYVPRPSIGGWYFPSPRGARWDEDGFSKHLRAANARGLLPWTCLDFRHTFGSHLAQRGISLYKISWLMGNSPEICRRHYATLAPEAVLRDVQFGRVPNRGSNPEVACSITLTSECYHGTKTSPLLRCHP